jgi:hypothetical protein
MTFIDNDDFNLSEALSIFVSFSMLQVLNDIPLTVFSLLAFLEPDLSNKTELLSLAELAANAWAASR